MTEAMIEANTPTRPPSAGDTPEARLLRVRNQISAFAQQYHRSVDSIALLAVSKWQSADAIRVLTTLGQTEFGESYLQEAINKQASLTDIAINWHFIGHLQSNKTRPIAENFQWVHAVDRLKIAQRLSEQRPSHAAPLNVCIHVKWVDEQGKGGAWAHEVPALAHEIAALPRLRLRGLMCLPPPSEDFVEQRRYFDQTTALLKQLNDTGMQLDTLSMGTSGDLAAAVAAGATIVRIGTAIFGERSKKE
jgi:PLP dependent protein